jgi:hypothetical protein
MTQSAIIKIFDLPASVPPCIVKIQDFDADQVIQENVRDYVISESVGSALERVVDRIITSCKRQEAGQGHYLHGSFGSGKSHFMAILGLILENNPAIWSKVHPTIKVIQENHGEWLASHKVLVVPIYMLGQTSLRMACYNAVNTRLQFLHLEPHEFSDADNVITSFRIEAERYGEIVFQKLEQSTGITHKRFDRDAAGEQDEKDALAQTILEYHKTSRAERVQLYPDKFSDGMAALTRHAQAQGFSGIVFLIDELILYLTGKSGREYTDEFNDLVALADNSALDRVIPLWVIVSKQRNIAETVPDDSSQQGVFEAIEHHKDRFPETTELADTELVPIVRERVLRVRPGMEDLLQRAVEETINSLEKEIRDTLLQDFTLEDFRQVYPFHPALIRTLIDITARLSRERAAIRLLYELLIERHADLPIGSLIPFTSLFDVVFLPQGLTGGSSNAELDAVRQTFYERLLPVIQEMYPETDKANRAQLIVKTILLCGLSKSLHNDITVERILNLNYQDLRGRTMIGSYQTIAQTLSELDSKSELVHFSPKPDNPALGIVSISLASGVQLADVLKRVRVNWRQRLDAFNGLMKGLIGHPIQNSEIAGYECAWRGTRRYGKVRFINVAELTLDQIVLPISMEFVLFVDIPFEADRTHPRDEDLKTIERARTTLQPRPIGFWLPAEFTPDDLSDLDEYARILELETNPGSYLDDYGRNQRQALESKLVGQKISKARALNDRLVQVYKGAGASVMFLDSTITPSLDADNLGAALDRIASAVFDRLYPYHPRFSAAIEANQRNLSHLLEEFMIPATVGNGSVPRNPDLDGWLTRLGIPLELAEQGATQWTLRLTSRYLAKLDELSSGKRVETNKIRRGLVEAFGFNRDLSDTFLLYLIRAKGYRVTKDGQIVPEVSYGSLDGLTLEQGERLSPVEWVQSKDLAKNLWQIRPAAEELTIAAQDSLWRQINSAASTAQSALNDLQKKMNSALQILAIAADQSLRLTLVLSAIDFTSLAMRSDLDGYEGLRSLLNWTPTQASLKREQVLNQITRRTQTVETLDLLQSDTLNRVITLAKNGQAGAIEALVGLRKTLIETDETAELASHLTSWKKLANKVIDEAINKEIKDIKKISDSNRKFKITSAQFVASSQTVELDQKQVKAWIQELLGNDAYQSVSGEAEIVLKIMLEPNA